MSPQSSSSKRIDKKNNGGQKKLKPSLNSSKLHAEKVQRCERRSRRKEYNIGSSGDTGHIYKFSGKQTNNWKKLDKNLHDYISGVIESGVKSVCSRQTFVQDQDVQELLENLKSRLKAKLSSIKVPKKNYGNYGQLRTNLVSVRSELQELKDQTELLERAIRQEERLIEKLEADAADDEIEKSLKIKVEDDELDLPKIDSRIT